jgi:hypothetical protein
MLSKPTSGFISRFPVISALSESAGVTGNRESKPEVGLDNILDIRKLAGLK